MSTEDSRPAVVGQVEPSVRPCAWTAHSWLASRNGGHFVPERRHAFDVPLYALNPKQVAVLEQYEAQQRTVHDVLTTGDCKHRDEPRGCYRVRCQLARKCHGA